MKFTMKLAAGFALTDGPKRGDLLQTNVGDKRERTWMVLFARPVKQRGYVAAPKFKVWAERWWEIEPEMRQALALSASRRGGQQVFYQDERFPAKKKRRTFEQLMEGR